MSFAVDSSSLPRDVCDVSVAGHQKSVHGRNFMDRPYGSAYGIMHLWIPYSISIEPSMESCNPKVTDAEILRGSE
eukprot:365999-Chlamydomonas_euryale.AAC.12